MIERHIETIFCDDIRHEINGKVSLIGVYAGGMFVPRFPITLPKLCLVVQVVTPMARPMESCVIRVFKDEELLQEIVTEKEPLPASAPEPLDAIPEADRADAVQVLNTMLIFSPIQLDAPCKLRVRVLIGEEELRGLALRVEPMPTANVLPEDEPLH